MKPSTAPYKEEKVYKPKIVDRASHTQEDKQIFDLMHNIANWAFEKSWNQAVIKTQPFMPMTGDKILSLLTTLASRYLAEMVANMNQIAIDDIEAGRTKEEIFSYIVEGARHTLGLTNG